MTGVEKACLNYGTEQETPIDEMTVAQAKAYMEEGQFEEGTMLPKIEAAIDFIGNSAVRSVLITRLETSGGELKKINGTLVHK